MDVYSVCIMQAYLSLSKFMRVWGYFYKHLLFERDAFICGSKGFQGWWPSFNLTLVSCFKRATSLATWKDLARQLDSRDSRWKEATRLLVWPWHCVLHPGTSYCSIPRIIFWFVSSETVFCSKTRNGNMMLISATEVVRQVPFSNKTSKATTRHR